MAIEIEYTPTGTLGTYVRLQRRRVIESARHPVQGIILYYARGVHKLPSSRIYGAAETVYEQGPVCAFELMPGYDVERSKVLRALHSVTPGVREWLHDHWGDVMEGHVDRSHAVTPDIPPCDASMVVNARQGGIVTEALMI